MELWLSRILMKQPQKNHFPSDMQPTFEDRIEVINYLALVQIGVLSSRIQLKLGHMSAMIYIELTGQLVPSVNIMIILFIIKHFFHVCFQCCWLAGKLVRKMSFFVIFLFKAKTVTRREFSLKMNHNKLKIAQFIPKR